MNFKHIRTLLGAAFLAGAAATAHSCINDDAGIDPTVAQGRPAQVSLSWSTSDMDRRTRASISEEAEHTVNSLWIGIYDYKTGRIKELAWIEGTREVTSTQGRIIEPDAQIGDHVLDATDAVQLHTLSGLSRIVAVANIDNYGVSDHGELAPLGRLPLRELLVRCDTWEKYCSVAALSAEPDNSGALNTPNISLTDANMPMAGIYYGTLNHDKGPIPSTGRPTRRTAWICLPAPPKCRAPSTCAECTPTSISISFPTRISPLNPSAGRCATCPTPASARRLQAAMPATARW